MPSRRTVVSKPRELTWIVSPSTTRVTVAGSVIGPPSWTAGDSAGRASRRSVAQSAARMILIAASVVPGPAAATSRAGAGEALPFSESACAFPHLRRPPARSHHRPRNDECPSVGGTGDGILRGGQPASPTSRRFRDGPRTHRGGHVGPSGGDALVAAAPPGRGERGFEAPGS